MKRILSLILCLALALGICLTAGAETAGSLTMVMVPVDAEDMRVAQCLAPKGYSVTSAADICSAGRSVTNPLGLLVAAFSPDRRTVMSYESETTYLELVSSTLGGSTYRTHTDGAMDPETLTPMARYVKMGNYSVSYLSGMFPGTEMTYIGSFDLSAYQPTLQRLAQSEYDAMVSLHPEASGINIDGVECTADKSVFSCTMDGEDYRVVVENVVKATRTTMTIYMPGFGNLVETMIVWSPLCTYVLACPADELETMFPAFEAFVENTTTSDQFNKANSRLADELRQIVVDARMEMGQSYSYSVLRDSVSSGDTYRDDRFSDYIFDQNDYTLSDGTHVKISTSYGYVYEGDNHEVYFTDSAFPEAGTRLNPN